MSTMWRSPELVSKITDVVLPEPREWQSRPLDPVYPILYLDAIVVKVRNDGRVETDPSISLWRLIWTVSNTFSACGWVEATRAPDFGWGFSPSSKTGVWSMC
jgi:Transposase, Mutator family